MLDNELAGASGTDGADRTTDQDSPAGPRRRRRAAGRPAGPPVAPPDSADAPQERADAPQERGDAPDDAPVKKTAARKSAAKKAAADTAPAAKAPAKKATARKTAAKKAAAVEAPEAPVEAPVEAIADEAPQTSARRTRKRAAARPAAAPPAALDGNGETEPAVAAPTAKAAKAAPATMPLFQPPAEEPAPTRRRRAAGRAAGEPIVAAEPDAAQPAEAAADEGEKDAPRARSRSRSTNRRSPKAAPDEAFDDDTTDLDPAEIEDEDEAGGDGESDSDESSDARRRRRRRGGRGRRGRGGRAGEDGVPDDDGAPEADGGAAAKDADGGDAPGSTDDSADGDADGDGDGEGAGTRRRRRRRRRGEDGGGGGGSDDPDKTVTRVRAPRSTEGRSAESEVTSIRGSTRLEAKKQRRREGREAGRRRVPIITESEFLARREAVDRVMVVKQGRDRTQIAVLEDGVLVEHYVNKETSSSLMGDVFLGRVQNVLPSMEAAFVDIGKGRNAVLYAGEVNFEALEGQPRRIEHALKSGQSVLVQVTKDPVGHKGARLTSMVSLPGRYLVYVPEGSMTGISRKLPDTERSRLKSILKKVVPEDAGVIIRTAAEGASEDELARDVERLADQWETIKKKAKTASAPALLLGEPDLTIRVVRDVFNEDFGKLVVAGDDAWAEVEDYVTRVAPDLAPRLSRWTGEQDVFAAHRVDEQILKALDRKVWLPSGGSLVIDRTEAMTVVDVNTGKFTGQGGNLEETVTRNNLEAAEEIVRQLRLRDIGGIIVVDFIDMVLEANRELVLRRLVECLGRDRTKHQVAEVTSLGLVQMTRKKVGQGLVEAFSESCEACNGRGIIVRTDQAHTGAQSRKGSANGIPKPGPVPAVVGARPESAGPADSADGPADPAEGAVPSRSERRRRRAKGGGGDPAEAGSVTASPDDPDAAPAPPEPVTAASIVHPRDGAGNGAVSEPEAPADAEAPADSEAPAPPKRARRRKATAAQATIE